MCSSGVLLGRDTENHLQLPHISSAAGREGNRIRDLQHHCYFALIIIHSWLYILFHAYLPEVNLHELIGNGFDQQDGVQGS